MTNSMVTKVAKALAVLNDGSEDDWESYDADARAAIEAMAEPSEAAVIAGAHEHHRYETYQSSRKTIAASIYTAMIQAALKE